MNTFKVYWYAGDWLPNSRTLWVPPTGLNGERRKIKEKYSQNWEVWNGMLDSVLKEGVKGAKYDPTGLYEILKELFKTYT